ncbi:hypothetical protein K461DRAFT_245253 [Myriangium duriaei CBS 260.36]|uniref:Uncharacterized protein n=1 Tax=Myriangium duriaei CBS 260.36 TaxID=1168546 RepID=A0A9P4MHG4_9PEZI|nr:hypothetical protein K461DRAFT_245253 [Myriangium duriaei CBS 260.36]
MERARNVYNNQYEKWMPWIEDQYLYYFTKDNKTSYATKDQLSKTKVTGAEPVDKLQDGVNDTVGGQLGKGGLLQPIGDSASKEGVNRAERGGKDDGGSYGGPLGGVTDPIVSGAQSGGSKVTEGAKGAGNWVGGLWGGKNEKK